MDDSVKVKAQMSDTERATLEYRLTRVESELHHIKTVLGELRDKVMSNHFCPAPGTCLQHAPLITEIGRRVAELEKWQSKLIGIGIVFVSIASILGPKVSALLFR